MVKTKRVAGEDKHEPVVAMPDVMRVIIVRIEPQVIAIAFHVEQVEAAVRVGNV